MDVRIFQFNGCNKCFNETILLKEKYSVKLISSPKNWKEEKIDVAVITGYLLPEDEKILKKIELNSKRVIAYGNCTTTGGIFALANQRGHNVTPLIRLIETYFEINGCLGEIEELILAIDGSEKPQLKNLCDVCRRRQWLPE